MATQRPTRERLVTATVDMVARRGVAAASLADIAGRVGVSKQTVLYHFGSKDDLVDGAIEVAVDELAATLRGAAGDRQGWAAVRATVRAAFALAARRPELLLVAREVARAGPPASTVLAERLAPVIDEASAFLDHEMSAGRLQRRDPQILLLVFHALVVGVATEPEVMQAVGVAPSARSLVRARRELLDLLEAALATPSGRST